MKIASVERALTLIEHLSRHPRGLSLTEISRDLGLNISTVHHLLSTLAPRDYVSQDPETKKYRLGFKFLTIGRGILDGLDIRRIAAPHLWRLHDKLELPVHLAVLRNGQAVYIEKIDKPGGLSLATYIGFATDPHAAAGGKVLLSEMSAEEVAELYQGRPFVTQTEHTIANLADLLAELDRVRQAGWAVDDEEYYEGARCVAAPVRAGGRIVAAVSVTGSIFTMTLDRIETEVAPAVRETAAAISAGMAW